MDTSEIVQMSVSFTIVVATRNRSELLRRAIDSILRQDYVRFCIVVVDDGSCDDEREKIADYIQHLEVDIALHSLPQRENGHGPAFSRNTGVALCSSDYVCFLDDDDEWIDSGHLNRVAQAIQNASSTVDAYYANQLAVYPDGSENPENLWLADLRDKAKSSSEACEVDQEFLLASSGFPHLNASIYRRGFFDSLNGFDEGLRYEEDRDLYLRALDTLLLACYYPLDVARHHIPLKRSSESNRIQLERKRLYQLYLLNKAIQCSKSSKLRHKCCTQKSYLLKTLVEEQVSQGDIDGAYLNAAQALACDPSMTWGLYTAFLAIRRRFRGLN